MQLHVTRRRVLGGCFGAVLSVVEHRRGPPLPAQSGITIKIQIEITTNEQTPALPQYRSYKKWRPISSLSNRFR